MGFGQWVADTARDYGSGVFGWETSAQRDAREQSEAATKEGKAERAKLDAQNKGLEQGISGYDPASISTCENWTAYSHQELFERNQKLEESKANQAADAWRDLSKELQEIGDRYSKELKQKIQGGWEGEAAEAAGQVGDPLSKWMVDSSGAFELTGNRVTEAASAAGQTKGMVPEPEGVNIARTVGAGLASGPTLGIAGGADALRMMNERKEGEQAAQETMGRVLGKTYQNVDTQVPSYNNVQGQPVPPPPPPPPPAVEPPPAAVNPSGTSNSSTPSSSTPSGTSSSSASPSGSSPAGTSASWAPQPGSGPGNHPGNQPPDRGPGGGMMMPPPVPPGGAGGGARGGGAGARGGAGGAKGGAAGGAGGAKAGGGPGQLGGGGRAGAGAVGGGPGAGAGAAGGGAAGGAGGARGGGGAMGGGGGQQGQGGDEEEHERPSWLEEHDDIWMNDMPKTAPPVFGE